MLASLSAAWRTFSNRVSSDWLILTAAEVTIVLATILLASGPIYADAVSVSALRRSLAEAPVEIADIDVHQTIPPDLYEIADELVRADVAQTFAGIGADLYQHLESESFGLPANPQTSQADLVDLVVFEYFEDIAFHTTLLGGSWPSSTGSVVETAVMSSTATMLDLKLGDVLTVTNRIDETFEVPVEIVGIFEIVDPADPFWFNDPLAVSGVSEQTLFRTYGPFVAASAALADELTRERIDASWRVFPFHENLEVTDIAHVRGRVFAMEDRLDAAFVAAAGEGAKLSSGFEVRTGLTPLLAETTRSLTVTRTSVLALLIQLAILAGYALVLTAGLLVGARQTETILLRSRGAGPNQILLIAMLEGIVLTIPAALAAPWLASQALELLNDVGPLSSIALAIEPAPTAEAYILAGLAAVGSVIALTWPAYRSARRFPESAHKGRQRDRTASQRAGVDIALLALTVLVFWQLQSLGPAISATVRGRFGIDPLVIVAPALGLLAGAVLALRMIPLMARGAEHLASKSRQTITALSSWQVSRRPLRYARSALLLIMAIAIGIFAAAFSTTWLQSQHDQAEFQVGADVNLRPNRRINDSISDLTLATGHETVTGIGVSMPILRKEAQLARSGGIGQFIFLDAVRADGVVRIRPDLAPNFSALMDQLADQRPSIAGIGFDGEPTQMGIVVSASEEWNFDDRFLGPNHRPGFDLRVSAVLQDGDGLIHKLRLGSIPLNIGAVRLEADLIHRLEEEMTTRPRYPLSLVDIEILSPVPPGPPHEAKVEIKGIYTNDGTNGWNPVSLDLSPDAWHVSRSELAILGTQPSIEFSDDGTDTLSLDINTGATGFGVPPPMYFSIRPAGTELGETYPVIVSESFLDFGSVEIGELVTLTNFSTPLQAQIVGTVSAFPTVDRPGVETVLVDLPTYQMVSHGPGVPIEPASEYWLTTTGDDDAELVSILDGEPFESVNVDSIEDRTNSLTTDPVALSTIGALTLGFVAAAVFATVGFAVSATVSARERIREFALLRALGLSPGQLGSWLSLEQGALVIVSLALGTLVGTLVTYLILPLVSLTQDGSNAIPDITIILPWGAVAKLELAVLAVLAVLVAVTTLLLRRLGLGSLLRLGDE
jgi:ABC-type lipoprotein release transport system permease subunit